MVCSWQPQFSQHGGFPLSHRAFINAVIYKAEGKKEITLVLHFLNVLFVLCFCVCMCEQAFASSPRIPLFVLPWGWHASYIPTPSLQPPTPLLPPFPQPIPPPPPPLSFTHWFQCYHGDTCLSPLCLLPVSDAAPSHWVSLSIHPSVCLCLCLSVFGPQPAFLCSEQNRIEWDRIE